MAECKVSGGRTLKGSTYRVEGVLAHIMFCPSFSLLRGEYLKTNPGIKYRYRSRAEKLFFLSTMIRIHFRFHVYQ